MPLHGRKPPKKNLRKISFLRAAPSAAIKSPTNQIIQISRLHQSKHDTTISLESREVQRFGVAFVTAKRCGLIRWVARRSSAPSSSPTCPVLPRRGVRSTPGSTKSDLLRDCSIIRQRDGGESRATKLFYCTLHLPTNI